MRDVVAEAVQQRLNDPRVSPLTTVTRVEMTGDLQFANVYLSVPGGDVAERKTMAAIIHAGGFIQRLVARELSIRQCPELRFEIDVRAKKTREMMELLEQNRHERPELFDADGSEAPDTAESNFEPDLPILDDDFDEGGRRTEE